MIKPVVKHNRTIAGTHTNTHVPLLSPVQHSDGRVIYPARWQAGTIESRNKTIHKDLQKMGHAGYGHCRLVARAVAVRHNKQTVTKVVPFPAALKQPVLNTSSKHRWRRHCGRCQSTEDPSLERGEHIAVAVGKKKKKVLALKNKSSLINIIPKLFQRIEGQAPSSTLNDQTGHY